MNNIAIDINNILNNFDIVAKAKTEIENEFIKTHKIKDHLELTDFLRMLSLDKNIFMFDESTAIPYRRITVGENVYIFYCGQPNKEYVVKNLETILNKIYVNKSLKLTRKSVEDLILNNSYQPEFPYFVIDKEMYAIESI